MFFAACVAIICCHPADRLDLVRRRLARPHARSGRASGSCSPPRQPAQSTLERRGPSSAMRNGARALRARGAVASDPIRLHAGARRYGWPHRVTQAPRTAGVLRRMQASIRDVRRPRHPLSRPPARRRLAQSRALRVALGAGALAAIARAPRAARRSLLARRRRHRVGLDRSVASAQPGVGRRQGDRLEGGARRATRVAPGALATSCLRSHRLPAQHGAVRPRRRARAHRGAPRRQRLAGEGIPALDDRRHRAGRAARARRRARPHRRRLAPGSPAAMVWQLADRRPGRAGVVVSSRCSSSCARPRGAWPSSSQAFRRARPSSPGPARALGMAAGTFRGRPRWPGSGRRSRPSTSTSGSPAPAWSSWPRRWCGCSRSGPATSASSARRGRAARSVYAIDRQRRRLLRRVAAGRGGARRRARARLPGPRGALPERRPPARFGAPRRTGQSRHAEAPARNAYSVVERAQAGSGRRCTGVAPGVRARPQCVLARAEIFARPGDSQRRSSRSRRRAHSGRAAQRV